MSGVPPVPWVWVRVVRACERLSALEKLVFDETRGLSNGRGATTSASALGGRLGVSRPTIERARRDLKRFGLLRTIDLGPGRAIPWFPDLPVACRPRYQRLDDDAVQHLGDLLAEHIERIAPERAKTSIKRDGASPAERTPSPPLHDGAPPSSVMEVLHANARATANMRIITTATRGERGERGERGADSKAGLRGENES